MTTPQPSDRQPVSLKPCPFCGWEALPVNTVLHAGVHCTNADCRAGMERAHPMLTPGDAMPDAIAAWNARPTADQAAPASGEWEAHRKVLQDLRDNYRLDLAEYERIPYMPPNTKVDRLRTRIAALDALLARPTPSESAPGVRGLVEKWRAKASLPGVALAARYALDRCANELEAAPPPTIPRCTCCPGSDVCAASQRGDG